MKDKWFSISLQRKHGRRIESMKSLAKSTTKCLLMLNTCKDMQPWMSQALKLDPAVHNYLKESMEKTENVEKGRSVTYRVVDCELMSLCDPYRVTFSFIPMGKKTSVYRSMEIKIRATDSYNSTRKGKGSCTGFLKWFDKYLPSY